MHVVTLTNAITPDKSGGLERYGRELSEALVERGVRVTILTKRHHEDLPEHEWVDDRLDIVRYPVPSKADSLFVPRRVAASIRPALALSGDPTRVLHSHFATTSLPLMATRRPYVQTFHAPVHKEIIAERQGSYSLPFAGAAVRLTKMSEAQVVSRAAAVLVLSDFMRAELTALSKKAGHRAVHIPGGVDVKRFAPGRASRHEWADKADPLLFTARRLTPRTGVRELIAALPAVRERFGGVRLAIAGEGRLDTELRRLASNVAPSDAIRFLGRVADHELVDWYRRADFVVMPTQELEGFGLTTAEALACGTPVAATPVGANPELISRLDRRLLLEGATSDGIASGLVRILSTWGRLSATPSRCRTLGESYGWPAIADRHIYLYSQLQTHLRSRRHPSARANPVS